MAAVEAAPSETDGVDPIRVTCLPARDPWNGSDPLEGRGQRVKTRRAPRPNQALGLGGRSRLAPRPSGPDSRWCDPPVIAIQPKTYEGVRVCRGTASRRTRVKISDVHSPIGTDVADLRSRPPSREQARAARGEVIDRRSRPQVPLHDLELT